MRCYPHPLERLLLESWKATGVGIVEKGNPLHCDGKVNEYSQYRTWGRGSAKNDSGLARRSTPAARFLENEISVSKRFLHHPGYCRTIYNPRNMQPTLRVHEWMNLKKSHTIECYRATKGKQAWCLLLHTGRN